MDEKRLEEIEARLAAIPADIENADAVDKAEAFRAEIESLQAEKAEIMSRKVAAEKIKKREVHTMSIDKPIVEDSIELQYRKAFQEYVQRGTEIPVEIRDNYITTTGSSTNQAGAVVPAPIMDKIWAKMQTIGNIINKVTITNYKGGLSVPLSSVIPTASWVAEASGSDTQALTIGSVTFAAYKLRCAIAVSLAMDTMALDVFENFIVESLSKALTKALETAILLGTGGTYNQPVGFLTETPADGQAINATPSYANLVAAEAALPAAYEDGVYWFMTKKTFMQFVALVDDDGQPIARVNYGLGGKVERFLLGREVVFAEAMDTYTADLTSGKVWAALFRPADYVVNTNMQLTVKQYEDNTTDNIVRKGIMLVDGKTIDKNSLVTLKKS